MTHSLQLILLLAVVYLQVEGNICAGKKDGAHSVGCSTSFYNCLRGIGQKAFCPDRLFFNNEFGMCDYRNAVKECVEEDEKAKAGANVNGKSDAMFSTSQRNFCIGRSDGPHSMRSCSEHFLVCYNGFTTFQKCPDHLIFDEEIRRCNVRVALSFCNALYCRSKVLACQNDPHARNPTHQHQFSCHGRSNGLYGVICTKDFWKCSHHEAFQLICPQGLMLNPYSGMCQVPQSFGCM